MSKSKRIVLTFSLFAACLFLPSIWKGQGRKSPGTPVVEPFDRWIQDKFKDGIGRKRKPLNPSCDLYTGNWVYDAIRYPLWDPASCPVATKYMACESESRHEFGLQNRNFRWQPDACQLVRFDSTDFRSRMRNKRLLFVGDSLARNQWLSMVCMASVGYNLSLTTNVAPPMSRYKLPRREIAPSDMIYFIDGNFSIEHHSTKFLIQIERAPKDAPPGVSRVLNLDKIHYSWPGFVQTADFAVLNLDHWLLDGHTYKAGFFPSVKGTIMHNMTDEEVYEYAIQTVTDFLDKNIDHNRTKLFFRSYSPTHERYDCPTDRPLLAVNRSTIPKFSRISKEIIDRMKNPMVFLNVTELSSMRPDGHIGLQDDKRADCSHWCSPGVPDVWSELLNAELIRMVSK